MLSHIESIATDGQLGPDGEVFVENSSPGMAHRKMSLVGGLRGRQPLFNEDYTVVEGGEWGIRGA